MPSSSRRARGISAAESVDKLDRYHGGLLNIVHYLGITPIIADPERIVNEREIKNLPPNIKILPGDVSEGKIV